MIRTDFSVGTVMNETINIDYYQSPCGELILGSYDGRLCLCDWTDERRRQKIDKRIGGRLRAGFRHGGDSVTAMAAEQLDEYFDRRRELFDIPLLMAGTDFQKRVWDMLLQIPYGATESYGRLSARLGDPKAVRAVAAANGANAISIFIPCHRIIGGDNRLVGYAGGLAAKRLLLELESSAARQPELF